MTQTVDPSARDRVPLSRIAGLVRCEQYPREALGELITELTHAVYPHEQVYGQYCTVHAHIECPIEQVYEYMADPFNLEEWTYSVRQLRPVTNAAAKSLAGVTGVAGAASAGAIARGGAGADGGAGAGGAAGPDGGARAGGAAVADGGAGAGGAAAAAGAADGAAAAAGAAGGAAAAAGADGGAPTSPLLVGVDAADTPIYVRTVANPEACTVDYHCAWDQGDALWMVYLNRLVPAMTVLNVPGTVLIWTNCHHPYYDRNPFPELAPKRREWVGDWWPLFYAGHSIELMNLKRILEHRAGKRGGEAALRPAGASTPGVERHRGGAP